MRESELRRYERKLRRVAIDLEAKIDRLRQEGYDEAMNDHFDREMVREALMLCHPDHQPPERSEQAHRVTAWLLGLLVL